MARSFAGVKYNGAVAALVPITDPLPIALKALSFHSVLMLLPLTQNIGQKAHGNILQHITEWVEQGQIMPLLDEKRFSIWEVAEAHRYFESGQAIGKVVLEV